MYEALMLALPIFHKVFVLETNVCAIGLGAVLSQKVRPLTYVIKALSPQHIRLSIYEKMYITILMAVNIWRH